MKRSIALLFAMTCALVADDSFSKYQFRMTQAIVTPKTLEESGVPFTFEISGGDSATVRIHVAISFPEKKKGTPTRASLVITRLRLPVNEEQDIVWFHDAMQDRYLKQVRVIEVPSMEKKQTEDFFLLSRADAEKSMIRVHYSQPLYGGDEYLILVGRFLKEANQPSQPTRPFGPRG